MTQHPVLPFRVDSTGRVFSLRGKLITGTLQQGGYLRVSYRRPGERNTRTALLHRIVAGALLPNLDDLPEVNHKDGIKTHNHPSNLEWVTSEENILHAYRMGLLIPYLRTERHRKFLADIARDCPRDEKGYCAKANAKPVKDVA